MLVVLLRLRLQCRGRLPLRRSYERLLLRGLWEGRPCLRLPAFLSLRLSGDGELQLSLEMEGDRRLRLRLRFLLSLLGDLPLLCVLCLLGEEVTLRHLRDLPLLWLLREAPELCLPLILPLLLRASPETLRDLDLPKL